ncbi:MAG: glutamate synthase large subunit [Planctomycetia bacterium]|nr:glutamate synthase large subunit [Planctomycetia bacterium]
MIQQENEGLEIPEDNGLYQFQNEHDACGVGMVVRLDNRAEHSVIEGGLTVLKRLMHRGATGADAQTGDGAGLLTSLPDAFFRRVVGFALPKKGQYAVAMIFGGVGEEPLFEKMIQNEGGRVLGWREVPTCPEFIGETAQKSVPCIRQLFIGGESFENRAAFERSLFVMRRQIEKSIQRGYIVSMSSRSIVYKGLLLASQIDLFYPDLNESDFISSLCVVHQRYSTNTFPTWRLAQPFRYLAHNGEINTLRGNLNQLRGREASFTSPLFGDDLKKVFPLVDPGQSDSACLDNMLELLVATGRSLPHTLLMLLPQAWGQKYHLGRDVRGFFEYHSELMEPWDGPAAAIFSDGINAGAILDRNGLRPARWTLTDDSLFVLASETGVLDFDPVHVRQKGRLRPGEMIWCDLEHHRLVFDDELKNTLARQKPYRRWAEENKIQINGLFDSITPSKVKDRLIDRQRMFGMTREDVDLILVPMAATGREPTGSMGNDAALAILSERPQSLFHYFKQLFAQVTNPPIDPIREELVMSLTTYIGNAANILDDNSQQTPLIKLLRPILTDEDLRRLMSSRNEAFSAVVFPMGWKNDLAAELDQLCDNVTESVRTGNNLVILSDRNLEEGIMPMPSLLAVSAVHHALVEASLRTSIGLIVDSGEIREVNHYALLLGYGVTAVCPYLALETIADPAVLERIGLDPTKGAENYIKAIDKGLLKIMSKMGISTLRSYRGAQIFEAIGLHASLINRYFPGTASRIGGIGIEEVAKESRLRYQSSKTGNRNILDSGGQYRFRGDGENHLWTPESLRLFREAVQENDPEKYRRYAELINDQSGRLCTIRGLFDFVASDSIPLEEVEPIEAILPRFVSGAMSLGSLSPEAHEAIAIAMNRLGAKSNCGEGGEDQERQNPGPKGEQRESAIRQVASGRFGVTIDYLARAKEIQIKMAQGAKPGEGGQLPGYKVDEHIARVRHSMPGVTLISPPPHHDIYSIEDLSQLIYDLRNANREARISVKLVSEVGVGTIAAGVAKAHADLILISGHDGGTGASPLTSIKHAGLPWELGLAETQQTLVLNRLRDRVRLQTDGQLKTGRDVIIAALLGAEEFGFATTILVCLGCVMMRKCHENCCPAGVATQDPNLRKCFRGKPEYIEHFLRFLAEEVRGYLAQLGFRSIDEAIGRSDKLCMNRAIEFYKGRNLDFSLIFQRATGNAVRFQGQPVELETFDDTFLLPQMKSTLEQGNPVALELELRSVNRSVGTRLSYEIVRRFGAEGLPEKTVCVNFHGVAGQSFGAFLAPGVEFRLEGEANDYVGKGLSGGTIVIRPPKEAGFTPSENVIAGNVIGYGATSGRMFFAGQAGERFAVRNSGAIMVVEGVGDHGCEYMTAGRVVVLGPASVNFAAGMTGGIAYVYDESNNFDLKCNVDTVDLESIRPGSEDESELLDLINEHIVRTDSLRAKEIVADWENRRSRFIKVIPFEYRLALERQKSHME